MGRALAVGLRAAGMPAGRLWVADPSAAARRALRRSGASVTRDNRAVARQCRVLVLAVKPQQLAGALRDLAGAMDRRTLVISIAAGIRLGWLESRLPGMPVARVMPNLPATAGAGFAALAFGRRCTARHRRAVAAIFATVGEVVELPESHFDAVTAVSGSGPAYVLYLVRAWREAAVSLGLPAPLAARAVTATLRGALALLERGGRDPDEWIATVASKRGTTEAALKVLAARRAHAAIVGAVRAAAARSRALSRAAR